MPAAAKTKKKAPELKIEALTPRSQGVAALYKVTDEKGHTHLVFFDRFGIYCEDHGIDCFVVAATKRAHH